MRIDRQEETATLAGVMGFKEKINPGLRLRKTLTDVRAALLGKAEGAFIGVCDNLQPQAFKPLRAFRSDPAESRIEHIRSGLSSAR